jgi:oxygen-dependent protoporphyrinogen oxidase
MTTELDVAIVGGGICGLAAAHALSTQASQLRVQLFEKTERFGGPIRTEQADGYLLEHGPDGFVRSKPAAEALIRELGLGSALIETEPSSRAVHVLRRGQLCEVPPGVFLVAPTDALGWLSSPLASLRGRIRALAEWIIWPAKTQDCAGDRESIAQFVTRRFGAEMTALLATSILAGIYSGDPHRLSIGATFPQLVALERSHGSVLRGLAHARRQRTREPSLRSGPTSAFYSLQQGMQSLIDRLVAVLGEQICEPNCEVTSLAPCDDGWILTFAHRPPVRSRALVVSVPPRMAALLLNPCVPLVGELLARRESVSSLVALLGFHKRQLPGLLKSSGFVVASGESFEITACTILSNKWSRRAPTDRVLLRAFMGGFRQPEPMRWSDEQVLHNAHVAFEKTFGLTGRAELVRVIRYHDQNPQMHVGHLAEQEQLNRQLLALPPLQLAGSGYDGVGIPDAIRQGVQAANIIHSRLRNESTSLKKPSHSHRRNP